MTNNEKKNEHAAELVDAVEIVDATEKPVKKRKHYKSVSNELRNIRVMKNMNLQDVAEQAGVTAMFISEIERGKKMPSEDVMYKLAKIYGITEKKICTILGKVTDDMVRIIVEDESPLFNIIFDLSTGSIDDEKKALLYEKLKSDYLAIKNNNISY